MLNANRPVVTNQPQGGDHVLPKFCVGAVANGAEYPAAPAQIGEGFGIQHAVYCSIVLVNTCILCVEMVYRPLKLPQSRDGVNTLPDEVARVEVGAYNIPNSFPQA